MHQIAKGDIVINSFDNSDSAAEVGQWSFAYGNGSFTSSDATISFSSDDANGSSTSGSLDVLLNFMQTPADQAAALVRGDLGGLNATSSGILMMDFDIKAVTGSATDQFGQSGFFNMFHANGPSFQFVSDFGDNLHPGSGWVHVDVPVATPNDAMNALFAQVYDNGTNNGFPGPNGLVEYRLDNVKFTTTSPPGTLRAGHQFSFESPSEVDTTHTGGSTSAAFAFGDSYDGNAVDHTQSTLHPTDGAHSVRLSQPLGSYHVGTQVLYNNGNLAKFNGLTTGTKLMIDITTPAHGPSYQTFETDLNFGGGYLSSYGTNNYQFVDGNPGGDSTRTTASTQTFTWDFGGAMQAVYGQYWPSLTNYVIIHMATGNGGAATGDAAPDATSEYFLDNVRVVNEDLLSRPTWQTIATANWTDTANWAHGVPNGSSAPAIFYGLGAGVGSTTASATVNVNSAITVGSIILDSQMTSFADQGSGIAADNLPQIVNYTLSGTGSLTFDSGAGASEIYAIAGNHTISVPVSVNSNLEIDTSAGFTPDTGAPNGGRLAQVAMTSLAFTAPITLASGTNLTTHGAGTVSFAAINGGSSGLVINGGHGNLNGNVNVGSFFVAAAGVATVAPGGTTVLRTGAIEVDGTLDLNNNRAIVDYTGDSPIATIRDSIHAGYNGGSWNGAGIISGTAAANVSGHPTAIGYAEAATLGVGTFAGQSVDSTAVVLQYALAGDANLDGKVNALDFNAIATSFGSSGKLWTDGDSNYDGTVNTTDFMTMAQNFNQVLAAPALGTLVPEPGTIALAAVGIAALGRRRRQR